MSNALWLVSRRAWWSGIVLSFGLELGLTLEPCRTCCALAGTAVPVPSVVDRAFFRLFDLLVESTRSITLIEDFFSFAEPTMLRKSVCVCVQVCVRAPRAPGMNRWLARGELVFKLLLRVS